MESADASGARELPPLTRVERGAFVIILSLFLSLSLLLFNQIEEDAFIYFRLVDNIADGYGYVFNRGGEPVEAGSSALWMLLLLLLRQAPLNIVITAKLLGLAAGCLSLWLVLRLSRLQIADRVARFGPPLLTAVSTPFLMWSQRGLETPLFVLLVLWLALCCTERRQLRWWPVVAVLLLLARPEAPLFLLPLALLLGLDRTRRRAALPAALALAGVACALLAARFVYFQDLVPSPFYVKLTVVGDEGLQQLRKYISQNHLLWVGLPFALVAWRRSFWTRERLVLGAMVLVTVLWCILANDYMPYARHLVPATPLIYVLAVAAADTLFAAAGRSRRPLVLAYLGATCGLALFGSASTAEFGATRGNTLTAHAAAFAANPRAFAQATADKFGSPEVPGYLEEALGDDVTRLANYQSRVGEFLRRNYPPDTVIVYDQMGQTPFYAGAEMRFIDSLGLTDRTVGRFNFERRARGNVLLRGGDAVVSKALQWSFGSDREPVTAAQALDYVFALRPDLILIQLLILEMDPDGLPALLSRDPRLRERYEWRYTLARFIHAYERKDLPPKTHFAVPLGLGVVPPITPSPNPSPG